MNQMEDNRVAQGLNPVMVVKSNGESVPFDRNKLTHSLTQAGAAPATVGFILREVEKTLHDGITTKQIYRTAFSLLKKDSRPTAARYKLKRAIMELGPSGYPFEQYVGELLKDQGFGVNVGVIEQGHCVQHEVDVIGERGNTRIAVECKFGNSKDKKVDVKVALYIHSRFLDIQKRWGALPEYEGRIFEGWIVTNGFFTEDAITYGTCAGLHLISWNYPQKGSLKDLIDVCHLHPVTSLTSLKSLEKKTIIEQGTVLCRDLLHKPELLSVLHLSNSRKRKITEELMGLCG